MLKEMDSVQYNIYIMNRPSLETYRESTVYSCFIAVYAKKYVMET
jgi:hypothetical protein